MCNEFLNATTPPFLWRSCTSTRHTTYDGYYIFIVGSWRLLRLLVITYLRCTPNTKPQTLNPRPLQGMECPSGTWSMSRSSECASLALSILRGFSVYDLLIQGLGLELKVKGTLLGTPNREPQEYSRNIIGMYLPGS